jgi:uncharacterized protein DUF2877
MANRVDALSMSWRVGRALREEGWGGEILAVFPHSCYLLDEDGAICALVEERAGNGPLNLVIPPAAPNTFQLLSVGDTVKSNGEVLMLSDSLDVGLAGARLWDPKPYPAPESDPTRFRHALGVLFETATNQSPEASLARLLPHMQEEDLPDPLQHVGHFPRSHALMGGLVDSLARRNRRGLKVVTSSMAGLGPGLTPACDDFLAGVLLALALHQQQHADAELAEIASMMVETASPRTGEISAAYLRVAHAGEAHERWHHLLSAIGTGDAGSIEETAKSVMQAGETSGADMLAGFLAAMRTLSLPA